MSYILDALSKSQKERAAAGVPTLMTEFPAAPSKSYAPGTLAGLGVAVACLGVLAAVFGLYGRAPGTGEPAGQPSAAVLPMAAPTATDSPIASRSRDDEQVGHKTRGVTMPVPGPTPASRRQAEQVVATTRRAARAGDSSGSPVRESNASGAAMVTRAPEPAPATIDDGRLSPATRWLMKEITALDGKTERGKLPLVESPVESQVAEPRSEPVTHKPPGAGKGRAANLTEQQVTVAAEPPEESTDALAALRDLPAETRSAIPALEINVHTYSDNPEDRMVFINMKRYREGDRLAEGPLIQAITPTGVVLVHERQRFRLPAR